MATVVNQTCSDMDAAAHELAGPFVVGRELTPVNAAPVKIIKEYLGKRPGSEEVVLLKILESKKSKNSDVAEEIRQGKMLLHTEFTILSLLHGMQGVCRHHGLFKDKVRPTGSEENGEVERVILALDCYHPHVYGDSPGERVNLQQYVIKQKRLAEKEALKLFYEILSIMEQMHASNVVHRDLKLGNMVLNLRTRKITIVNFCLSKHLVPCEEKLTDQRGSLAYVSPDILSGSPYCGKASDCWALGVLLYTMLYGQFPFYDCSPHELFRKIKSAQYVIPNDGRVSLGTKLLINRLIALDPCKRLTAAGALEETQRIMSKWHTMVCHDGISPMVPDMDNNSNGNHDDMFVPELPRNGALLSQAANSELNMPRLGITDSVIVSIPVENSGNDSSQTRIESRAELVEMPTASSIRRQHQGGSPSSNTAPVAPMLVRRGIVNRRNLRLNLRRASPPIPQQNSATPTYSYTAIGHTPNSPPPMLGGSPQMFGGPLQHPQAIAYPVSPGLTSGHLVYSYVPSPVSGVPPDSSGFFRVMPGNAALVSHQAALARYGGNLVVIAGNKRRRNSVDNETERERVRVVENSRGDPLLVRVNT